MTAAPRGRGRPTSVRFTALAQSGCELCNPGPEHQTKTADQQEGQAGRDAILRVDLRDEPGTHIVRVHLSLTPVAPPQRLA